jgi:uroporphyrinogen-III synthase
LLDLPELIDVSGRRVIIFRGDGGRELLGETLKARGATIEYVTCYRRDQPQLDPAPLLKLWEEGRLDAVTLTSSEGLRNFFDMVGRLGQAWLKKTPAFVPHQRIAEQAEILGLAKVIATEPGDDGLMAGLVQYFASHGNSSSN